MAQELPDLTESLRCRKGALMWPARLAIAATVFITALLQLTIAFAADTTPPTKPVVNDDGAYSTSATQLHATWSSSDPESGVAEYQYQIRQDSISGPILVNWTSTGTANQVTRTDLSLQQGKSYYFAIKAKNKIQKWSAIGYSNGIRVDTTAPGGVTVADDGMITSSTSQLHATWTSSSDLESGIIDYQYQIRQDSTTGLIVVDWTSVALATQMTRAGLSLSDGKKYLIGVRAKNGAGLLSATAYSDGIRVNTKPPTITEVTPADGTSFYPPGTIPCTVAASDPSGDSLQYRFLVDGQVVQDWGSLSTLSLNPSSYPSGVRTLRMEARDPWDGIDGRTIQIYLFHKPLEAKE